MKTIQSVHFPLEVVTTISREPNSAELYRLDAFERHCPLWCAALVVLARLIAHRWCEDLLQKTEAIFRVMCDDLGYLLFEPASECPVSFVGV